MEGIVKKLRQTHTQLTQVLERFSQVKEIGGDDEFEVEYLTDSVEKEVKNLHSISLKYHKPEEPTRTSSNVSACQERIANLNEKCIMQQIQADLGANDSLGKNDSDFEFGEFESEFVAENDSRKSNEKVGLAPSNDRELPSVTSKAPSGNTEGFCDDASDVTEEYLSGDEKVLDEALNDLGLDNTPGEQKDSAGAFSDEEDDMFDESALAMLDEAEKSHNEGSQPAVQDDTDDDYDPVNQPQDKTYLEVLKKYFGYAKFRPMQWKIIDGALNQRRDQCVVMATGYGKSLCYQYPSVYTGNVTLVISPLISLMEDQVLALSTVNIEACFLGSAQTNTASVKDGILRGQYRVVYLTPEFAEVAVDFIQTIHSKVTIDLIAIDEAHCVSQWGHDFRSAYRGLGKIRQHLKDVPLIALTATATPEVRVDICKSLNLKNTIITTTSFDRPNLYLSVTLKSGDIMKDLKSQMTRQGNKFVFEGPCIIYCPTRKAAENVNNIAKLIGLNSALYHAGLGLSTRKSAHRDFVNDKLEVIVATVAFGMGIDKPDVRKIIHYGAPKDLECYYQEMGRAGRDGLNSTCHVFYSHADFSTNRYFLKEISSQKFKDHKSKMLHKMEEYLATTKCRRRAILSHFENKDVLDVGGSDQCCDNCGRRNRLRQAQSDVHGSGQPLGDLDTEVNLGKEARDLFNAVDILGGRFGLGMPIAFLMGSTQQRLPAHYHSHGKHGSGKYKTQTWWKAFGHQLKSEGHLTETSITGGFGATVSLSSKSSKWLASSRSSEEPQLMILPNQELMSADPKNKPRPQLTVGPKILPLVPVGTWVSAGDNVSASAVSKPTPVDPETQRLQGELFKLLISTRDEISTTHGIPVFRVFTNKTLQEMAKFRPTSIQNISKLEEVAEERARKYGQYFVDSIKRFCERNDWPTDMMPSQEALSAKLDAKMEAAFHSLGETQQASYIMFAQEQKPLEEVAARRGLKASTVVNHLSECIKVGLPVNLDHIGVTQNIITMVTEAIRKPPINSDISRMTPIKDQLPTWIEFSHIKVVMAILQRKFGMSDQCLVDEGETRDQGSTGQQPGPSTLQSQSSQSPSYAKLGRSSSSPASSNYRTSLTSVDSQSQQDGGKRKLPNWMAKGKASTAKKMKKNTLFDR